MKKPYPISVVIPSYKNEDMMKKNLIHNVSHLEGCEIIVVNDYPPTNLKEILADVPQVQVIERQKNGGFGAAVNTGVAYAHSPFILLLNTDVVLEDDSYLQALPQLQEDESLFAVTFAQTERDGSTVGKNAIYWKRGLMHHKKAANLEAGPTAWAEGGSCLLKKQVYDMLGGFDLIYAPFYWEDVDLSYRAQKAGYSILFDPKILVEHHHETTTGQFDSSYVKTIALRNQILFVWRNITDLSLMQSHTLSMLQLLLSALMRGQWWMIRAWIWAVQKRLTVSPTPRYNKRRDRELIDAFTNH